MAGNNLWLTYPAAISTKLSNTEMASLVDANVTVLSSEIDNSTNQHLFADFQIDLASCNVASTTAFVTLFVVPTADGTNYPFWQAAAGAQVNYNLAFARATFLIDVANATHRSVCEEVRIPPGKFKIAVRNGTGVTWGNATQTVAMRSYSGSYS